MNPRLITLCGAMYCTAVSAQEAPKRPAFPYAGYVRPQLSLTDTVPGRSADSMRLIQLKTFTKRGKNYLKDSLEMERLLRGVQQPKLGSIFLFDKTKPGNVVEGADGRKHQVAGLALDVGAISDLLSFGKNNRNDAFRRRLMVVQREGFFRKYYSPEAVARFIPLRGDSLDEFVDRTRPPADLLANGTAYDLGMYVKRRYLEYLDTLSSTIKKDTVQ
ncbi:hypothetical protein [Chitinophaga rhizosphaerae]|uniref:hypothetical protein n=1 Tax=Chitinophaga rhizosphaerae TaxID=1864947 RepID=UPI000F80A0E4|nr:hypothetical protein [Chitinophaga rhizosphaerae]